MGRDQEEFCRRKSDRNEKGRKKKINIIMDLDMFSF